MLISSITGFINLEIIVILFTLAVTYTMTPTCNLRQVRRLPTPCCRGFHSPSLYALTPVESPPDDEHSAWVVQVSSPPAFPSDEIGCCGRARVTQLPSTQKLTLETPDIAVLPVGRPLSPSPSSQSPSRYTGSILQADRFSTALSTLPMPIGLSTTLGFLVAWFPALYSDQLPIR